MSQSFMWVNFTKRQFLQDEPFPYGLRYTESCYVGNLKTDAASTLLEKEWRGDVVAFAGEHLFDLREAAKSGRYPGLAKLLEAAIDPVDIEREFEGVAGELEIARFRFMVNKTKRAYYDRESTQVVAGGRRFDPLPLLLGTAWGSLLVDGGLPKAPEGSRMASAPDGLWVGDLVYPSDDRPEGGYEDVSALYALKL